MSTIHDPFALVAKMMTEQWTSGVRSALPDSPVVAEPERRPRLAGSRSLLARALVHAARRLEPVDPARVRCSVSEPGRI